ncbi:MAG: helix-turn-helix transcriptional regulator [Patescibacteria group bacterium]|nr:helix-turn-helix transcriptional regulator [Patescibacteria group bacterium]
MVTKVQTLREMRLDKRLTQSEVADRLKVSQSYYSAIERGAKPGEVDTAMRSINRMRTRTDRTEGGSHKAGRQKG